jgi:hypothetical protein
VVHPDARGGGEPVGAQIETGDAAACRTKGLREDQTNQAKTDHSYVFAELGLAETKSMKRDGPESSECGMVQRNAFRDACTEVAGNEIDFGVGGGVGACTGYTVARRERSIAGFEHYA